MIDDIVLWGMSQKDLRKPTGVLQVAFDKTLDPNIGFLKYDSGMDYDDRNIYASETSDVLQQWDQYIYEDFSDRILEANWKRQETRPASVCLCQADIILDNIDDLFTPENTDSPLFGMLKPGRPLRLSAGFEGRNVRQFIGLTEGLPQIDEKSKQVTFHAIDFLTTILSEPLRRTVILQNQTVDQIIGRVLSDFGLGPQQYDLEPSTLEVPFFYAEKGDKILEAFKDLVTAEIGALFMDETGMIRFLNRGSYSDDVVAEFSTDDNIYDGGRRRETDLINRIELSSEVRRVEPYSLIFESTETITVPPGSIVPVWANIDDPIVSVETPTYDPAGSHIIVNTQSDGQGDNSTDVSVFRMEQFGKSVKLTFRNSTGVPLYITSLVLYGEAARIQDPIYVELVDQGSVDQFGDYLFEYESSYIGSVGNATEVASLLLFSYGLYAGVSRMVVKGSPQLQIGDMVTVDWYGRSRNCRIVSLENSLDKDGFTQVIHAVDVPDRPFFNYDDDSDYDSGNIYNI